MPTPDLYHP
jgi:hypothetical protein